MTEKAGVTVVAGQPQTAFIGDAAAMAFQVELGGIFYQQKMLCLTALCNAARYGCLRQAFFPYLVIPPETVKGYLSFPTVALLHHCAGLINDKRQDLSPLFTR